MTKQPAPRPPIPQRNNPRANLTNVTQKGTAHAVPFFNTLALCQIVQREDFAALALVIAKHLVDHPEQVVIDSEVKEDKLIFKLKVAEKDVDIRFPVEQPNAQGGVLGLTSAVDLLNRQILEWEGEWLKVETTRACRA